MSASTKPAPTAGGCSRGGSAPRTANPGPSGPESGGQATETATERPAAGIGRFSPSAINRWQTCRKQFWYQDVERAEKHERPSPILSLGNAVHEALAKFYGLRPEERSVEVLHQALRSVWPANRQPEAFINADEEARFGLEALEMLSKHAKQADLEVVPLARESWASTRLENGVEVFGKVDRVDSVGEGDAESLRIIDYKTGRHAISAEELPNEPAALVYITAIEAEYGLPVEEVTFLYLRKGRNAAVSWQPSREQVASIPERLITEIDAIRQAEEFPATPGRHCDWCPFAMQCEDRHRVELSDLEIKEEVPF